MGGMDPPLAEIGRLLLGLGVVLALLGLVFLVTAKVPWIGRLPGDIVWRRGNFTFYFPLATSILVSLLLSLVLWLLSRR